MSARETCSNSTVTGPGGGNRSSTCWKALASAFRQVLDRLPPPGQVTVEMEHVSLGEKLEELRQMLARQAQLNFSTIFRHARTRLEAVITFLALLELIRIGEARVAQASAFAEITVHGQERKETG